MACSSRALAWPPGVRDGGSMDANVTKEYSEAADALARVLDDPSTEGVDIEKYRAARERLDAAERTWSRMMGV